jgi:hypothetical protein
MWVILQTTLINSLQDINIYKERRLMKKKVNINKSVIVLLVFLIATYIPIFMREEILDIFVREDKIYEILSPIYLFIAAIMFAYAFHRSPIRLNFKDPAWLKRLSFLGFSLLFLFAAFEEISWGQRIFDVETPNLIKGINVQKELTIHNLNFFQGDDAALPLDFDQLSAVFALAFGFVVPVTCLFIKPIRLFLASKFPILPFQVGLLYPVNYIIQKLLVRVLPHFPDFYQHTQMKIPVGVHEVREHDYALLLMMSAVFYILMKLDLSNEEKN